MGHRSLVICWYFAVELRRNNDVGCFNCKHFAVCCILEHNLDNPCVRLCVGSKYAKHMYGKKHNKLL